jgi:hypothetical protein
MGECGAVASSMGARERHRQPRRQGAGRADRWRRDRAARRQPFCAVLVEASMKFAVDVICAIAATVIPAWLLWDSIRASRARERRERVQLAIAAETRDARREESHARLQIFKAEFPWLGEATSWDEARDIALDHIARSRGEPRGKA